MSSYLNLFLKTKSKENKESEYLFFMSFSRNSEIYQHLDKEIPNLYCSNGEIKKKISIDSVNNIIKGLNNEIQKNTSMYHIYKDCKDAESALTVKDYIRDLNDTLCKFEFINLILIESSFDHCDFEGLYGYID